MNLRTLCILGLLVGCGDDDGGDGPGPDAGGDAEPSGPRSIEGTVLSREGLPVGGALIAIGDQVGNTNAEGKFQVADVSPPYDLHIAGRDDDGEKYGYVFVGVTRSDPTVYLTDQDFEEGGSLPYRSCSQPLSITLPGNPAGVWGYSVFDGVPPAYSQYIGSSSAGTPISYTVSPYWYGQATMHDATFHALLHMTSPTLTYYYATAPVTVKTGTIPSCPSPPPP